ncbi:MAG: hypothetical protein E7265_11815 [Lachnospiraceae bacterium]|nr:hypothetical protein [Lachnospiraceae bacterium]
MYIKVGWKDWPSKKTPVNTANLQHMDDQIEKNAIDIESMKKEMEEATKNIVDLENEVKIIDYTNINNQTNSMFEYTTDSRHRIGVCENHPVYRELIKKTNLVDGTIFKTIDSGDKLINLVAYAEIGDGDFLPNNNVNVTDSIYVKYDTMKNKHDIKVSDPLVGKYKSIRVLVEWISEGETV